MYLLDRPRAKAKNHYQDLFLMILGFTRENCSKDSEDCYGEESMACGLEIDPPVDRPQGGPLPVCVGLGMVRPGDGLQDGSRCGTDLPDISGVLPAFCLVLPAFCCVLPAFCRVLLALCRVLPALLSASAGHPPASVDVPLPDVPLPRHLPRSAGHPEMVPLVDRPRGGPLPVEPPKLEQFHELFSVEESVLALKAWIPGIGTIPIDLLLELGRSEGDVVDGSQELTILHGLGWNTRGWSTSVNVQGGLHKLSSAESQLGSGLGQRPHLPRVQSPGIQCFVPGECLDSQILDTVITNSSRTCLSHCQKIQGCEWFTFYADSKICTSLSGCLDLSPKKCPECLDSQILDTVITNSSRTCLSHCQKIQGCEWFTFYADSKICTSLSGCLDLSPKKCPGNCISGENECPEFQCGLQGRCFGALEGIRKVGSARECGTICGNRLECFWHTYNPSQASCTLTNDCPALDKSCADCVVSETECGGQGYGTDEAAVTPPSYALMSIRKSPHVLNLTDMKPVVCQGAPSPYFLRELDTITMRMNYTLYQMSVVQNKVLMMAHFDVEQRKWTRGPSFEWPGFDTSAGFTRLGDGSLFFPNGKGDSSFYIDEGGAHKGPEVQTFAPEKHFSAYCFTTISANDVFLSGGKAFVTKRTQAKGKGKFPTFSESENYLTFAKHINPKTKAVVSLPDMPQALVSHVCSTYVTKEGPKVLILGGTQNGLSFKNQAYYVFDWTTQKYTKGDETKFTMPFYTELHPSIPFGDTVLVSLTTVFNREYLQFYKFDPRNSESVLQLRGECLDSQILDTVITNSSRTCLHHCQKIQGCEWFTFYADSKICTSLSGCLDLSPKKCPGNCISGENECPEFQCGLQGRCFGALEGIRKVGSARECGTICSNRLECLWHTYNPSQASCTLTNDCPALDKSCSDCVVSETQCEAQEDGQTTALEDGAVIPPSYALLSIGKSPYIVNLVDLKPVVCQDTPSPDFGGQSERMTMRMNNILYQMSVSDNRLLRMAHFDVEQRKWTSDRSFEFGERSVDGPPSSLDDVSAYAPDFATFNPAALPQEATPPPRTPSNVIRRPPRPLLTKSIATFAPRT
eukprot:maker-scaffold172_size289735-snap-gene-1.29 protein:Tk06519 transcript:maker-scaffold172_size289735-snap-gene-1.29-mRNA-1 annotation:"pan domain-containing protein"